MLQNKKNTAKCTNVALHTEASRQALLLTTLAGKAVKVETLVPEAVVIVVKRRRRRRRKNKKQTMQLVNVTLFVGKNAEKRRAKN